MDKCALTTLGCKVNQCETQAMSLLMRENGYEIVEFDEIADVYIINTCCVTAEAERKSRQLIRRAKKLNPQSIIAVMGCYAQRSAEEILKINGVTLVVGTDRRSLLPQLIREKRSLVTDVARKDKFEELPDSFDCERTRAFIKIQDGCNNFCSYCIIPYVRGRECSRSLSSIVRQAQSLAEKGFCEIVLNGIHLSGFGKNTDFGLIDAVKACAAVDGICRVRLGSLEPNIISEQFLTALSKISEFCPNFHISLQSGSNGVLQRMNRKYNAEQYFNAVCLLRKFFPDASVSTDIITGFPGESEAEFNETKEFVRRVGFAWVHVFPYSVREGTVAAKMQGQIPEAVKKQRAHELGELCALVGKEYRSRFCGKSVEVLGEVFENGIQHGLTREHIAVEATSDAAFSNSLIHVKITAVTTNGLAGKIEK